MKAEISDKGAIIKKEREEMDKIVRRLGDLERMNDRLEIEKQAAERTVDI